MYHFAIPESTPLMNRQSQHLARAKIRRVLGGDVTLKTANELGQHYGKQVYARLDIRMVIQPFFRLQR